MNAQTTALPAMLPSRAEPESGALAALETGAPVIVLGEPGSGRTVFGSRLLVKRRHSGRSVHRIAGSPALADVPFAAVAGLGLQIPGLADAHESPAAAIAALAQSTTTVPRTLLLDDADHIDPASAAVFAQMTELHVVSAPSPFEVVVTAERVVNLPQELQRLASGHTTHRVQLSPLDFEDARVLLEDLLGGPLNFSAVTLLLNLSGRNALHLREVALDALAGGAFSVVNGYRTLRDGWLPSGGRVSELVSRRLAAQAGPLREAVEIIAVTGPVPRGTAEQFIDTAVLDRALDAGLLIATESSPQTDIAQNFDGPGAIRLETTSVGGTDSRASPNGLVQLGAGLTEELVLATVGTARLRSRADRIRTSVPREHLTTNTRVQVTEHLHRLGVEIDVEHLREDVEVAEASGRFDAVIALTARLPPVSDASLPEGLEALLLSRASALAATGKPAAALEVIAPLLRRGRTAARLRAAQIEFAGLGRADLALRRLAAGPGDLPEVRAMFALLRARAEHGADIEDLRAHIADPTISPGLRLSVVAQLIVELLHVGRPSEGIALFAEHREGPLWRASPSNERAELIQAMFLAMMGEGSNLSVFDPHFAHIDWQALSLNHATFLAGRGLIFLEAGDASQAADLFGQALALLSSRDPLGLAGFVAGLDATASVMVGDRSRAEQRFAGFTEAPATSGQHARMEVERAALAVILELRGSAAARARLEELVADAEDRGRIHLLMRLLHDAWRLRIVDPDDARFGLRRLSALAQSVQGGLARSLEGYAEAFGTFSGDAVETLASGHLAAGRPLYAAEVAARGAESARERGDRRGASRLLDLFAEAAVFLPGVNTPSLGRARIDAAPLSDREREVCKRAAASMSNAEIASELFLSSRTVEGHLQRAYAKLGVADRRQLLPAMRSEG